MNARSFRQLGLSLVELLVALALAMLLIAGFLQIFMSVRSTYAAIEALARVQENGRFALDVLTQHARQAGYRDPGHLERPSPLLPAGAACSLSDRRFCSVDRDASLLAGQGGEVGDQLGFTYQPALTGSVRLNCLGNVVGNQEVILTRLFTRMTEQANGQLTGALWCQSSGTGAGEGELVEGVDAFQVQYGIGSEGQVRRYARASEVGDWNQVIALRLAVLVNSQTPLPDPLDPSRQYYLLDAGPYQFTDNRLRQVFTTTVLLRNAAD